MKVKVYQAILTIGKRQVRLTKSIAKQLPILDGRKRWRAAEQGEPQSEPIAKVIGKTLGEDLHIWMYLIEDPEAGLGWVAAMNPHPDYAKDIVERGGWIDHPENVPTIIL
jgi:hypothetical protein